MRKYFAWMLILVGILTTALSCATVTSGVQEEPKTVSERMEAFGFDRYPASHPELYHYADLWHERSLDLIEEAEEYIIINIFLGTFYSYSQEVWDALKAKVDSGVAVYCILDSASYFSVPDATATPKYELTESNIIPGAFTYLREIGVEVVEYNPFAMNQFIFLPSFLDRDHRKFWIIDGTYLALGGANINYSSIGDPPGSENIDSMALFRSPQAIEEMIHSFVATWNQYSPKRLRATDFPVTPLNDAQSSLYLVDHKWPEKSETTQLFDALMHGATEEIWMVQSYAFLTKALNRRIKDATDRGVAVNVILSEHTGNNQYVQAIRHSIIDLIKAGATVYMFESPPDTGFLHLKLFVVDQQYAVFGSANYNLRSQMFSREIAALYDDPYVAQEALEHVEDLLEHCRVIDEAEAKKLRSFSTFFFHLAMQIFG